MNISTENNSSVIGGQEIWRVGDLLIDVGSSIVKKGEIVLEVSGLSFDLLVALARAAPKYLSHDDLMKEVWQGRFVSQDTIVQRVKLLRDALGDNAANPLYIGLVKRRGYKLLPEVCRMENNSEPHSTKPKLSDWHYWAIGTVLLIAILLIFWPQQESPVNNQAIRQGIAVLPFSYQDTSSKETDFFASGIHDDIITELAKAGDLLVISRTSVLVYKETARPITEIGRELNVDKILEGTVQRTENKVKINVQLIDARSDTHLWANSYEREISVDNIINIQRQIAIDVSDALHASLAGMPEVPVFPTDNMEAYELYLSGRQHINTAFDQIGSEGIPPALESLRTASEQLRAAVDIDPRFAEAFAYLSLANSFSYEWSIQRDQAVLNQAASALLEAVALDPSSPRVNRALSQYYRLIGNSAKSLAAVEQAAKDLPHDTDILIMLAFNYLNSGQTNKALEVADKVVLQDPLNPRVVAGVAGIKTLSGDLDGAKKIHGRLQVLQPDTTLPINEVQRTLTLWGEALSAQNYDEALSILRAHPFEASYSMLEYRPFSFFTGQTHFLAGDRKSALPDFQNAREEYESILVSNPNDPRLLAPFSCVLAHLGEKQLVQDTVKKVLSSESFNSNRAFAPVWSSFVIGALLQIGDFDKALDLLERQIDTPGPVNFAELVKAPFYDPVRNHPRFQAIARKLQQQVSLQE